MTHKRSSKSSRRSSSRVASEFEKLQAAAGSMPGVADLFQLYTQHAARVEEVKAYLSQRPKTIVFTSSDATF
jgi:hypothetical protein